MKAECSECGWSKEVPLEAMGKQAKCPDCSAVFVIGAPSAVEDPVEDPTVSQPNVRVRAPQARGRPARGFCSTVRDYFMFRRMLATALMKVVYILGAFGLTVGGLVALRSDTALALLALTVGNVIWRLLCEGVIVIFSIHEGVVMLVSMAEKGK